MVNSVQNDASHVHLLLPKLKESFQKMEPIFASIDRLEAMVLTAAANCDILEREVEVAEQELAGEAGRRPSESLSFSGSPKSRGLRLKNSAGTAIKKLFKPKSSSSSNHAGSPNASGQQQQDSVFMAPQQLFFASDFFPDTKDPVKK